MHRKRVQAATDAQAAAVVLEEYARQLVSEATGDSIEAVERRGHRETVLRRRRQYELQNDLGLQVRVRDKDRRDSEDGEITQYGGARPH